MAVKARGEGISIELRDHGDTRCRNVRSVSSLRLRLVAFLVLAIGAFSVTLYTGGVAEAQDATALPSPTELPAAEPVATDDTVAPSSVSSEPPTGAAHTKTHTKTVSEPTATYPAAGPVATEPAPTGPVSAEPPPTPTDSVPADPVGIRGPVTSEPAPAPATAPATAPAPGTSTAPITEEVQEPAPESAPAPLLKTVERTVEPISAPIQERSSPAAKPVEQTVEPVTEESGPLGGQVGAAVEETTEPVNGTLEESAAPVREQVEQTVPPAAEPVVDATGGGPVEAVGETAPPVLESADPAVGALEETVKPVEPVLDKSSETLGPLTRPVLDAAEGTLEPVQETVHPILGGAGEVLEPVVKDTVAPRVGAIAPVSDATIRTVPQVGSPTLEPAGGRPVVPDDPVSAPLTGAMPAVSTESPTPALGTPGGANTLATTIGGLLSSEPTGAASGSLAWERPEALTVAAEKAISSSAWGVRGPPAVVVGLDALGALIAAAHANTLYRILPGGSLVVAHLLVDALRGSASGAGAPNGGSAPLPVGPAVPSPASSSSGLGASATGGLGLGVLALLLALSPLGARPLRSSGDFLRPTSAHILAIERPG